MLAASASVRIRASAAPAAGAQAIGDCLRLISVSEGDLRLESGTSRPDFDLNSERGGQDLGDVLSGRDRIWVNNGLPWP